MDRFRAAVAEFGEVVGVEDVEGGDQDDASGRRRRGADDGEVVEGADDRDSLFDFVFREVFDGKQGAALLEVGD